MVSYSKIRLNNQIAKSSTALDKLGHPDRINELLVPDVYAHQWPPGKTLL
jgi:hypothetical protein